MSDWRETLQQIAADHWEDIEDLDASQACAAALGEIDRRWHPMSSAPTDGTLFLSWSPGYVELPPMFSLCAWHPDAGFCVDELRTPTHWMPLPDAPKEAR